MTSRDSYYPDPFFADLGGEAPVDTNVTAIAAELSAVYGVACPPPLAQLLAFCADPPDKCLGEFCPWPRDDWLPPQDGNAFEWMLEESFRVFPLFADTLAIGSTGSGDLWAAALEPSGEDNELFLSEHDNLYELHEVADSVATFAFLNHVLERGECTTDELAFLDGRVALINDVDLNPPPATSFASSLSVKETFVRGNGVAAHLNGDWPGETPDELPGALVDEVRNNRIVLPAAPLLVMWALFFQNREDELPTVLHACSQHAGRMVRDSAALLAEVLDGRNQVGQIEDLRALRNG